MDPSELLDHRQIGDWNDLRAEDCRENTVFVTLGYRVLSVYPVGTGRA